ncbi:MAG: hypothetical protein V7637_6513 [Mycobacteriales bacterium]
MAHGVFINYRGADSQMWATLIYLALSARFGESGVFLDSTSLGPGDDFEEILFDQLRASSLVLALIGPRWLTATGESGQRLIDAPADWVRRELAEAFARDIRVVPVLTDDARLPAAELLPPDLVPLTRRQFVRLRRRHALDDLAELTRKLARLDTGLTRADRTASYPGRHGSRAGPCRRSARLDGVAGAFQGADDR